MNMDFDYETYFEDVIGVHIDEFLADLSNVQPHLHLVKYNKL